MKLNTKKLVLFSALVAILFFYSPACAATSGSKETGTRILILGQPRSGTTALYSSIKTALEEKYKNTPIKTVYEPQDNLKEACESKERIVLSKVLINAQIPSDSELKCFDKVILLVRDPRDRMISSILFSVTERNFMKDQEKRSLLIKALEEKEVSPRSISLLQLHKYIVMLAKAHSKKQPVKPIEKLSPKSSDVDFVVRWQGKYIDEMFKLAKKPLFIFKYEDFVDNKFDTLNAHLDLELKQVDVLEGENSRVARTKGYGSWKNWLTEDDIPILKSAFAPYMKFFGYKDEWKLNEPQVIQKEHASDYVKKNNMR